MISVNHKMSTFKLMLKNDKYIARSSQSNVLHRRSAGLSWQEKNAKELNQWQNQMGPLSKIRVHLAQNVPRKKWNLIPS